MKFPKMERFHVDESGKRVQGKSTIAKRMRVSLKGEKRHKGAAKALRKEHHTRLIGQMSAKLRQGKL